MTESTGEPQTATRRITLLRHAKAEPKHAKRDFDRVLAPEGRAQMERIARHLAETGTTFDVALVSPAARTRETWEAAGLPGVEARFEKSLYDAPVEAHLDLLRGLDESVRSVVIVAHNPGLEELAGELVTDGIRFRLLDFPTAGLAVFDMPAKSWRKLKTGTGTLVSFATPATV